MGPGGHAARKGTRRPGGLIQTCEGGRSTPASAPEPEAYSGLGGRRGNPQEPNGRARVPEQNRRAICMGREGPDIVVQAPDQKGRQRVVGQGAIPVRIETAYGHGKGRSEEARTRTDLEREAGADRKQEKRRAKTTSNCRRARAEGRLKSQQS
jgi:hypothetical protein